MSWHEGEGKAARIRVPPPSLIPKGGWTGKRGENLRGIEDAIKGLGCRLGCCLPVADVQHRPTRQRRPSAERCPPGTSAPRRGFLTENSPPDYFPIFLRLLTL